VSWRIDSWVQVHKQWQEAIYGVEEELLIEEESVFLQWQNLGGYRQAGPAKQMGDTTRVFGPQNDLWIGFAI